MEINLRRGAFFNLFGDKIMDGRIFLFSCLIIFLFLRYKGIWSQLPRLYTRLFIFSVFFLDAYFGLLFNEGFLNIFNQLTGNLLPSQKGFIWLIQILQAISAGFGFVKIAFDDLPKNLFRTISISLTPVFLLFVLWLVCDALITGRNTSAIAYLDFVQISTSTLRWAATYLSIAVALTLTYRVQRYGNFAQSEYFMLGMYVAMAIIWTDYFLPLTIAPADGVLVILFAAHLTRDAPPVWRSKQGRQRPAKPWHGPQTEFPHRAFHEPAQAGCANVMCWRRGCGFCPAIPLFFPECGQIPQ